MPSGTLTGRWELPAADAAWAVTHDHRYVYVVAHLGGRTHILDTQTREIRSLPVFGGNQLTAFSANIASDGILYAATYPDASIWQVDPATGEARVFTKVTSDSEYARSMDIDGRNMVVGTSGADGALFHVDMDSRHVKKLAIPITTPSTGWVTLSLRGDTFVAANSNMVVKMNLEGRLLGSWQLPGGQIDTLRMFADGSVWATSRPDGLVHRLLPQHEEFEFLGKPADGQEHREIAQGPSGEVVGLADNGTLWTWREGGSFSTQLLRETDLTGPVLVQDLCLLPNGMVAASGSGIMLHHPTTNKPPRFVPISATPIRLAYARGRLYTATYPRTEIISINPGNLQAEKLAVIGKQQLRPWSLHHDRTRGCLVIATEGANRGPGALSRFDLNKRQLTTWPGVLGSRAVTSAITVGKRTLIAGGLTAGTNTALAEVDLDTGEVLWLESPMPEHRTVESIAHHNGIIYGSVRGGHWFAYDLKLREVIHHGWIPGALSYGNIQVLDDRVILPVHAGQVFELDLRRGQAVPLLDGIGEGWRRGPKILFDGKTPASGWGMIGMQLGRIDLNPCHLPPLD